MDLDRSIDDFILSSCLTCIGNHIDKSRNYDNSLETSQSTLTNLEDEFYFVPILGLMELAVKNGMLIRTRIIRFALCQQTTEQTPVLPFHLRALETIPSRALPKLMIQSGSWTDGGSTSSCCPSATLSFLDTNSSIISLTPPYARLECQIQ